MLNTETIERIRFNNTDYALIIRKETSIPKTRFFSDPSHPLQVGIVAHEAGYTEIVHKHKEVRREIRGIQQMLYVEQGSMSVDFFTDNKKLLGSVELRPGDTILLIDGAHSIRVHQDVRAISVKQGPFLGDAEDKINL